MRTLSLAKRGIWNYFSKRPLSVSFEVTYKCNARCKHCHLGGPVDEERTTPQRFGELARQIQPVVAQISGGEPLLRKDLEEIVQELRIPNRAPFIVVTTNGVLLTRERYESLRRAGVDEFSLSLDYPDERHDDFRRVPGLFRRIEKLVKDLDSNGEKKAITVCCVVQRDNFRDLLRLAELATDWNVKMNFSTYTSLRTHNKEYMIPREELPELREIAKKLLDIRKKHKNVFASEYIFNRMIDFFENESIPNCQAGEKFYVVNPSGTLSPCGLIIKEYKSQEEIRNDFMKSNTCGLCNTSIRANSEKPVWYLIKDNIGTL
ncbi:MAG: radical SAM protein [bacterium]